MEQNACVRHMFPELCLIGALDFYFFYYYHVENHQWPDYSGPESWYDKFVVCGADENSPISYSTQYEARKYAYVNICAMISKKVHIGRSSAGQTMAGANSAQQDLMGHWANTSRNSAYQNQTIPWECIRCLAGFNIHAKSYYIERDLLRDEDLEKQIFPDLEDSLELLYDTIRNGRTSEHAGFSWLNLSKLCRKVILQDAVVLMNTPEYCNHSIFTHRLFRTEQFSIFQENLGSKIRVTPVPQQLLLQQATPIISECLQVLQRDLIQQHSALTAIEDSSNYLKRNVDKIIQNQAAIYDEMKL